MKKVYSISLSEKLVEILDKECLRTGGTRSEIISNLLIERLNKGIDPEDCDERENENRKLGLLKRIRGFYTEQPEFKEFIRNFELDCELVEKDFTLNFSSSNRKFTCDIKAMDDGIKFTARVNSSSEKHYGIFENAYEKHKSELESQGFKRDIYQRFWNLEYKSGLDSYPDGEEANVLARYLLQKFLVLYTNFLIELDFIVDKSKAEEIIEKTDALKKFEDTSDLEIKAPYLEVLIGAKRGKRYAVKKSGSIRIGRSNCDIELYEQEFNPDTPVVSKEHAELLWENKRLCIRDLGSTNGTLLNRKTITKPGRAAGDKFTLENNDQILIANIELKVVL